MTSRRLVRPTGLLAEHAAMETERDDALLRAERAETRETELEQEVDRLKGKLRRRSDTIADLTSQIAELRKYVAGVKNAKSVRLADAWDEGYEVGYGDRLFEDRGLFTDPDAHECPHANPYRTRADR